MYLAEEELTVRIIPTFSVFAMPFGYSVGTDRKRGEVL